MPSDLSNVKVAQTTDSQLQQFIQKVAESGMTDAQIQQEFTKKWLACFGNDVSKDSD